MSHNHEEKVRPETPCDQQALRIDAARCGDAVALNEMANWLCKEGRFIAKKRRSDCPLGTSSLANAGAAQVILSKNWRQKEVQRGYLFNALSRAIDQIAANAARDARAKKRGGGNAPVSLECVLEPEVLQQADLDHRELVHRGVRQLQRHDPDAFIALFLQKIKGLRTVAVSEAMGVSPNVVRKCVARAERYLESLAE